MGVIKHINAKGTINNLEAIPIIINNKKYLNIKHGNKDGWEVRYSIDSRITDVIKNDNYLLLGSNFVLKPIIINNDIVKDKCDNTYYVITKTLFDTNCNDMYIFLETTMNTKTTKITSSPNITILGNGVINIMDKEYLCPVFEVYDKGFIELRDNDVLLRIIIDGNKISYKEYNNGK